jgi:hypothetical protein
MNVDWVSRILDTVSQGNLNLEIYWNPHEQELGAPLPDDFKELAESIGLGDFSEYLYVFTSGNIDQFSVAGDTAALRKVLEYSSVAERVYEPYRVYIPGGEGLIQWGRAVQEGVEFYWLAGGGDPAKWPVLARMGPSEEGYRFDMTISEFVYRLLNADLAADPFRIPEVMGPPRYGVY